MYTTRPPGLGSWFTKLREAAKVAIVSQNPSLAPILFAQAPDTGAAPAPGAFVGPIPQPKPATPPPSRVPTYVMIGAGALIVGGLAYALIKKKR